MGVMEMEELVLLCTMVVFFTAGYFVMKKLDRFFEENLRMPDDEEESNSCDKTEETRTNM